MTKDDLLMNANEQYHGAFFVVWRLLTIMTEVFMMMVTPISTFIVGCTANKKAADKIRGFIILTFQLHNFGSQGFPFGLAVI